MATYRLDNSVWHFDAILRQGQGVADAEEEPVPYRLDAGRVTELSRRASRYTLPYFEVVVAKMILMAATGMDNDEIAARLDTRREVVSQWRRRFFK